jgi:hypothetical protein
MAALADLVGSAVLVALTVTFRALAIEAGPVYIPLLEMVPSSGLNVHVTAVLVVPITETVNGWDCEIVSEAVDGLSDTVAGVRLMVALADLVGLAMLVAFTVTFCDLAMEGSCRDQ